MTWKGIEFCQNYPSRFLFQIKNWLRKETWTYQGREHLLRKKLAHYSPFSIRSNKFTCTTAARIDRKAVFTKLVLLKPWSRQNPFLFLKIQASNEIVWLKMRRTDQRTPRRSLSLESAWVSHVSLSRNRPIAFYVSSLQDDHP